MYNLRCKLKNNMCFSIWCHLETTAYYRCVKGFLLKLVIKYYNQMLDLKSVSYSLVKIIKWSTTFVMPTNLLLMEKLCCAPGARQPFPSQEVFTCTVTWHYCRMTLIDIQLSWADLKWKSSHDNGHMTSFTWPDTILIFYFYKLLVTWQASPDLFHLTSFTWLFSHDKLHMTMVTWHVSHDKILY